MNLMVLYRRKAKAFLWPSWKHCLSWSEKGSQRKTSSQWLREMVKAGFFRSPYLSIGVLIFALFLWIFQLYKLSHALDFSFLRFLINILMHALKLVSLNLVNLKLTFFILLFLFLKCKILLHLMVSRKDD